MKINHALAMVIGCTLSLAYYRGVTFELQDSWMLFGQCYATVMGSSVGVMLAGAFILARRWWHDDPTAMSQPGHWLLVFGLAAIRANAGALAAYYAAQSLFAWYYAFREAVHLPFWMPFRQASAPYIPGIVHQAVCWGLAGAAALVLCFVSFRRLPWSHWAVYPVVGLCALIMSSGYIAASVLLWGRVAAIVWCNRAAHIYAKVIVVCSLIVALAVIRDLRQGRRGDFLHWTGIVAWSVIATMQMALYCQCMLPSVPATQYIAVLLRL